MMVRSKLLIILAPHFTAGVEVGYRAAPIIKYMAKWSEEKIRAYCFKKGWKIADVEFIDDDDSSKG